MKLGYVRVSTVEQNEARQMVIMKEYGVEKIFSEKVSAKDANRPRLHELLEFAREHDTIYVESFSRLARNTQDLLSIVDDLNRRGIHLVSNKEKIDTNTPTGKLLLTVMAAIHQFERENLKERQAEGIAIAKAHGVYKGRKPLQVNNLSEHYERWRTRQISKSQLAKDLGISRQTLYNLFAEYERNRVITISTSITTEPCKINN